MHTKYSIKNQLSELGINPQDTLLVHSSMKSIGAVENGADAVLDALSEYLRDGLLVFPTHTWKQMNSEYNLFNPATEPSCVGILSNLFLKRPQVFRSWHPTHSVAALGKDAAEFVAGEEQWDTPCARKGCWGKLYDRQAKILFIGCSLKTNTILHGVEEWQNIPLRLTKDHLLLKIIALDGRIIERPIRDHQHSSGDISQNYDKIEDALLHTGIARKGLIGDAASVLCDAKKMVDLVSSFLWRNPDIFDDKAPVPTEWYQDYHC